MANPQTQEDITHELFGAVKIEASAAGSVWTDFGAVQSAKLTEQLQVSKLETQNAVDRFRATDQTGLLEFTQLELLNDAIREIIRGGLDVTSVVAGTPVAGATQTELSGAWGYNDFIKIANQNGDGTIITVNSVTGGTDGLLVEDTDYFIGQDLNLDWGLFIIDSTTVTTLSQDMVIDYDYTPNASTVVKTGGVAEMPEFYTRITNTEPNPDNSAQTRTVQWVTYGTCQIGQGIELEFKKYNDEDDRVENPIVININQDIDQAIGERLWTKTVTIA